MGKNKSLNRIENVLSDNNNPNGDNSISAELTNRLQNTVIDYLEEFGRISANDVLKAINDLNKEILEQAEDNMPEVHQDGMLDKVEELINGFLYVVKEKYGDKPVDWIVLYYACTSLQNLVI